MTISEVLTNETSRNPFKTWVLQFLQKDADYNLYSHAKDDFAIGLFLAKEECMPLKVEASCTFSLKFVETIPDVCASCNTYKETGWILSYIDSNNYLFYCIGCVFFN